MKLHKCPNLILLLSILCTVLYTNVLKSQTQFTGPDNGDWFAAGNWSSGLPTLGNNATIPSGKSVVINTALTVNFKIESFGSIANNSIMTVQDTVISGGVFSNTGTVTINTGAVFTSSGGFTNIGTLNNNGLMTSNSVFTNNNTGTVNNSGTSSQLADFINNGDLNCNAGSFTCSQVFMNNKSVKNLGTATFTLDVGCLFTNAIGSTISNAGNFRNFATFTNNSTVTNLNIFQNNGVQNCTGSFDNLSGGSVTNSGTVNLEGTWNNDAGGTTTSGFRFVILNVGMVNNEGVFTNNDSLNIQGGGTFNNITNGTLSSFFGSSINNDGDIIVNTGSTLSTNGEVKNFNVFDNFGTVEVNSGGKITNSDRFTIAGILKNISIIINNSEMTLSGTFQNNSGGTLNNAGNWFITNTAKIINDFEITNMPNSAIRNDGIFTNNLRFWNDGIIESNGSLIIVGDFFNRPTGSFTNKGTTQIKGGSIKNEGVLFSNTLTLRNESCSVITNITTINNSGIFENKGIVFQRGTLTGNAIVALSGWIQTSPLSEAPSVCIPTLNTGSDINGEAKVYAQSLMNTQLGLDTCLNFQYFVDGVNRRVYNCPDIGKTLTARFKLLTRTGDSLTCSTQVSVTDNIQPTITNCPSNIAATTFDTCAITTWADPIIADNCPNPVVTITSSPTIGLTKGSCFPAGITTVTYKATDVNGYFANCIFTVNITRIDTCNNETVPPVLVNCQTNQVLSTTENCIAATWIAPTATDNCSTPTIVLTSAPTLNLKSGDCFPIGTTTLTYTATDAKNNSAVCSFTITVNKIDTCNNETVPPVLVNCPTNQVISTTENCIAVTWVAPTATDNCSTPTIVLTSAPTANLKSGDCFPVGTTTLTYTATDAKNNSAVCSFTVAVNKIDTCANDTTVPVFVNCPLSQILDTKETCAVASWVAPNATDNCSTPTIVLTSVPTANLKSGDCFPVGTTTLTYTATDAKNNSAVCSFTVTVNKIDTCANDITVPVFVNCPLSQILDTKEACAVASWVAPTATDNCSTPTIVLTSAPTLNLKSGDCFPIGTTTLTYTATDAKNNSAVCSFTVTVNKIDTCANDTKVPVFVNCPLSQILDTKEACAVASWVTPTATDNCSTPTIVFTSAPTLNLKSGDCFPVGTTTLTYTATDAKNNSAVCSFIITVNKIDTCANDRTVPVFVNCPLSQILDTKEACAVASWVAPTATDNCSTPTVVLTSAPTLNLKSGDCFPVGTTTLTYTATDAKNNSAVCSFTVTVNKIDTCANETVIPTFTNCPVNQVLSTTGNCIVATWEEPIATDNCTPPSVSLTSSPFANLKSGDCFPKGLTNMTYTATDANNNKTTCRFSIVVNQLNPCINDIMPPKFDYCPTNQVLTTTGNCAMATWITPIATDNCTPPSIAYSSIPNFGLKSGSCFPIGTTTVTYLAADPRFNIAQCIFTITVKNESQPIDPNKCYKIVNKVSGKILDLINDDSKNGTYVVQSTYEDMASQQWQFLKLYDGSFNIINRLNGKPLTSYSSSNGSWVYQWDKKIDMAQRWRIEFYNGSFRIINAYSNKALDLLNSSLNEDAAIGIWSFHGGDNQLWQLVEVPCENSPSCLQYGRVNVDVWNNQMDNSFPITIPKTIPNIVSFKNDLEGPQNIGDNFNTRVSGYIIAPLNGKYIFNLTGDDNVELYISKNTSPANLKLAASIQGWTNPTEENKYPSQTSKGISLKKGKMYYFELRHKETTGNDHWRIRWKLPNGKGKDPFQIISSQYLASACSGNVQSFNSNQIFTFEAKAELNQAKLLWVTNTGHQNDYFEVERLNAAGQFEMLDVINANSDNDEVKAFDFTDSKPLQGENDYRIKTVLLDGTHQYSEVKKLNFNHLGTVNIFPNPANDFIEVDLSIYTGRAVKVYIYNQLGKLLKIEKIDNATVSPQRIDTQIFTSGTYLLRVQANGKREVTKLFNISK